MIEITRKLYFDTKQGTLQFTESSPVKEQCDHQVCNCTKAVKERPDGEPNHKQQYIKFHSKDKDYSYEVGLAGTGCNFTLRWPGVTWDKDHLYSSKNHAYYWFNSNGVENMINVEIVKPDYGRTNCFFANLYLGNQIDTSKFFNGHSNTKIVDQTILRPDEVWAHDGGFGSEAQCSMRECDETVEWRGVYALQKKIQEVARTYDQDFVSDVEKIRESVEQNATMLQDVDRLCHWFRIVTKNLPQTELFRVGDYCYKNSWK